MDEHFHSRPDKMYRRKPGLPLEIAEISFQNMRTQILWGFDHRGATADFIAVDLIFQSGQCRE